MTDEKQESAQPRNEIEYLIDGARRDLVSVATLYLALLRAQVWVMCDREWDGKSVITDLKTLVMKTDGSSPDLLPVFTDPERATLALSKYPEYPHLVRSAAALALLHAGGTMGLALNPGGAFDLQIKPQGIDQMKQAFGPHPQTAPMGNA